MIIKLQTKRLLSFAVVILISGGLRAQDVVINKVYNSSSGNGNSDVIELLVIKDKLDMRGMYLKDAIGAADRTTFGEAGRIMFMDNELWNNLRSGTTIQIGFYTGSDPNNDDLDASDRRIRVYKKNKETKTGYLIDVKTAPTESKVSTFEISPYNIIAIKKANSNGSNDGAAAGYVDLVHAFLPYLNTNYQTAYDALTGPDGTTASSKKMAGNSPLPTDGWVYATNPTKSLADYNAFNDGTTAYIAKGSGNPHYGLGEPGNNATYIATLRTSITTVTPANSSAVVYTVEFVTAVTGVDASDFSLTTTGTATGSIASVTGSGSTYEVTVNDISGTGTIRLDKNGTGTAITDEDEAIKEYGFTSGDVYTVTGVLPIELVSFDAKLGSNKVSLNWRTSSELNSQGFLIERSAEPINWVTIGTINAKGEASSYKFDDIEPLEGNSYYRLKMVDMDNSWKLSNIKPVFFNNQQISLTYSGNTIRIVGIVPSERVDFSIVNMLGVKVLHKTSEVSIERNASVELPSLARGIYLVHVNTASFHEDYQNIRQLIGL